MIAEAANLNEVYAEQFPPRVEVKGPASGVGMNADASAILDKARNADNGSKFCKLFDRGDISDYAGDDSRADQALVNMIVFWTGPDRGLADQLFRLSALCRDKWLKRPDYREATIGNAIALGKFYDPNHGKTKVYDPVPDLGDAHAAGAADEAADNSFVNSVSLVPTSEKEWPELHVDALHGLPGAFVVQTEPHTEADPAAVLIQLLASFGSAAGRNAYFVAGGSRHYPNLYATLVCRTSKGRKGTSWAVAKHPFERIDPDWLNNCVNSGLSSGEGLIWQVRDPIEKRVAVKAKGRPTGEYDTVIEDDGIPDKRLMVLESEFANVLKVMQRDGNTVSAVIRNAWDNGNLKSMVKNSPACATSAHVSIIGHITFDELRRYMDRTEAANGLGNRFLWALVRRSKCLPEGGDLQSEDFSDLYDRMNAALSNAKTASLITRDSAAKELWASIYPTLSEGQPGMTGALTSRSEAQVMRLAMIYALMDEQRMIRLPHLKAGIALWNYCESSVRYIFGSSMGDPVADELLQALRARPEGMTRTEISQHFANNREAAQISNALMAMSERGLVRMKKEEGQGKGRKPERWFSVYGTKQTKQTKE
ncbi:MAG TPA: hypothetical protein VH370_20470 [Humisphaera sp.]|nr:hypothetical protein [Humisphaera sp.]